MKHLVLLLTFIISASFSFGQKQTTIWYFGDGAGLDFSSGNPEPIASDVYFPEGSAVISSEKTGKLLFYTDGETVWNKKHETMLGGTGLKGYRSSVQPALIVPDPCDSNTYYIFTTDGVSPDPGTGRNNFPNDSIFSYSMVDMSLDSGFGEVILKNISLFSPVNENVAAVKHANRKDTWVVAHRHLSDQFYAYLVTENGVEGPVISSPGGRVQTNYPVSSLQFSPRGDKVAFGQSEMEVFDFDNTTGIVAPNPINLGYASGAIGFSFSPNGQLLYVSRGSYNLVQYDLTAGNSAQVIATADTVSVINLTVNTFLGKDIRAAPDGKMYVATRLNYSDSLGVINNPNVVGEGCDYVHNGVFLENQTSRGSLPNFIASYFDPNWTPLGDGDATITPLDKDTVYTSDAPFTLSANNEGGIWSGPGIKDSILGIFDPFLVPVGEHVITYGIPNTCFGLDSIVITVATKTSEGFIPNSFSPNNDNINDTFSPQGIETFTGQDYAFSISDRWGKTLFETNNSSNGWDGNHKGKIVPAGVYLWKYSITDRNGGQVQRLGKVVVIR